jgi:hypothetical protein
VRTGSVALLSVHTLPVRERHPTMCTSVNSRLRLCPGP